MVRTQQITPAQFLDLYSRREVDSPITIKVGNENRVYGRTGEGLNSSERYKVVYCVVT